MADLRAVAEEGAPCHGLWASGRQVGRGGDAKPDEVWEIGDSEKAESRRKTNVCDSRSCIWRYFLYQK